MHGRLVWCPTALALPTLEAATSDGVDHVRHRRPAAWMEWEAPHEEARARRLRRLDRRIVQRPSAAIPGHVGDRSDREGLPRFHDGEGHRSDDEPVRAQRDDDGW